jgi:hypothetical protein
MARKFVTGDSQNVVVKQKRERVETACQGCGAKMTIMSDHVGDILCTACMKPTSYSLERE